MRRRSEDVCARANAGDEELLVQELGAGILILEAWVAVPHFSKHSKELSMVRLEVAGMRGERRDSADSRAPPEYVSRWHVTHTWLRGTHIGWQYSQAAGYDSFVT